MAQLTQCDRCGTTDGDTEQIQVRGVRVDLCGECMEATFSPWLEPALARVGNVPVPPLPSRANPWPRPPQHGYTAAAIEAAQEPTPLPATGGQVIVADPPADSVVPDDEPGGSVKS